MEPGIQVKVTRQYSPRYGLVGKVIRVIRLAGQIDRVLVDFAGFVVSFKATDLEVVE